MRRVGYAFAMFVLSVVLFGCGNGTGDGDGGGVSYNMPFAYLQYRTYSNGTGRVVAYVQVTKDGGVVNSSDVTNIKLTDSNSGAVLSNGPVDDGDGLKYTSQQFLWYDCFGSTCKSPVMLNLSGFWDDLTDLSGSLSPSNYTYEATFADGSTVSKEVEYYGAVRLPVIDASTVSWEFLTDGSISISWKLPSDQEGWDKVTQLRLVLYWVGKDPNDSVNKPVEVAYVKLSSDDNNVTLPVDMLTQCKTLGQTKHNDFEWTGWGVRIQTRAYDDRGNNYARGYSDYNYYVNIATGSDESSNSKDTSYDLPYGYVQYRTYSGGTERVIAYIQVTKDGEMVDYTGMTDININLIDSDSGAVLSSGPVDDGDGLKYTSQQFLWYDCFNATCKSPVMLSLSGFWDDLTDLSGSLSPGSYTYEATFADGSTVSKEVEYYGAVRLPVIDASTVSWKFLTDGSLSISWKLPSDQEGWDKVTQLRLVLYWVGKDPNDSNKEWVSDVAYVKLSPNDDNVTLPADVIIQCKDLGKTKLLKYVNDIEWSEWKLSIQTRAYDDKGNNYARGYSDYLYLN